MYQPIRPTIPREVDFYRDYFAIPPEACPSHLYGITPERETDIYVITFNNLFLVEYQIKTLRKFFRSPFNLIIVDNNNWLHPEQSKQVLQLCMDQGVTYLKAPDNFYQTEKTFFDPSMKLGTTMNWLYVNCVRQRKPRYFGFLDHDCFLVRDFGIRSYLDTKGMYGRVQRNARTGGWNLHVTTNFFRSDFVGDRLLDFRASYPYELDTGGANYDVLYKDFDPGDYELEYHSNRFAREDVNRKDSVQHYETIDNGTWYHMCASTHDQLAGDGQFKLAYTKGYLDARLQKE